MLQASFWRQVETFETVLTDEKFFKILGSIELVAGQMLPTPDLRKGNTESNLKQNAVVLQLCFASFHQTE